MTSLMQAHVASSNRQQRLEHIPPASSGHLHPGSCLQPGHDWQDQQLGCPHSPAGSGTPSLSASLLCAIAQRLTMEIPETTEHLRPWEGHQLKAVDKREAGIWQLLVLILPQASAKKKSPSSQLFGAL